MDYTIEEISPVKKKINITVSPEEVDAAIKASVAIYRDKAELDGFRKGKVPANVVEKRFHDAIYNEAHDDLINVHINEILQKLDAEPVSAIKMEGEDKPLKKGAAYEYTMEFEVAPKFDLPVYEGLEAEQEKVEANDAVVERLLKRVQREKSQLVPVDGAGPAKDGQVVSLDFEAFEDGKPLEDVKASNFELELGAREALPEFEAFIKEIPAGHTAEKEVQFPDDFISPAIAGKKLKIKATVHAIKERKLSEIDDRFAKSLGKADLAQLKSDLASAYVNGMAHLTKAEAQKKILDSIVKRVDFPLPPSMVDMETAFLLGDHAERMMRMGKNPGPAEEVAKLKDSFRPAGETRAKEKIVLLAIAKKENLDVTQQEIAREVANAAMKLGKNPQNYFKQLHESGMLFQLRDNMLCDKAMDLVYERANIKMVEPKAATTEEAEEDVLSAGSEEAKQDGEKD